MPASFRPSQSRQQQQQQQDATRATSVNYFFGRISRDEAETALRDAGCHEGLFLLRESVAVAGNYVLSICHEGSVHHYSIERQPDGSVMIQDGRPFAGPVELIHHHSQYLDGFLTKPKIPCSRPDGKAAMAWPGVTMLELELILLEEADRMKISKRSQLENALGPQRQKFVSKIAKSLHVEQPWYHGNVDREVAEQIMAASGHRDGKYLMRMKDRGTSYAMSISFHGETKHYLIDQRKVSGGIVYAIERGPPFDNLMDLVAHYYNKMDGLLCKLTEPCIRKDFVPKTRSNVLNKLSANPTYGISPTFGGQVVDTGIGRAAIDSFVFDEPEVPDVAMPSMSPISCSVTEMEKIYDSVRSEAKKEAMKVLDRSDIDLMGTLGSGNFGSVERGTYRYRIRGKTTNTVPVAVKILKTGDLQTAESELMTEAQLMAKLDHKHIVRMIGICRAENIMLVLELAGLGPLNKYLKKQRLAMPNIVELMHQVASGMAYLESNKFVHRDLAARNVLLADEHHAKISDFGMSKALGFGNQYYKAANAGKWPIKWYAPECIYFLKFDSKSDVWSYGIVLWEATSYGDRPYKGFRGRDLITMIAEEGKRLEKPPECPQNVYDVMHSCWQRLPENRPTFQQLVQTVGRLV
jgi:hypothetical protein